MADDFASHASGLASPGSNFFAITPDNGNDLATYTRGIYVGVSGDISIDGVGGGTSIVLQNLAAGVWHPIRAKRVRSTGTAATGIVGCS